MGAAPHDSLLTDVFRGPPPPLGAHFDRRKSECSDHSSEGETTCAIRGGRRGRNRWSMTKKEASLLLRGVLRGLSGAYDAYRMLRQLCRAFKCTVPMRELGAAGTDINARLSHTILTPELFGSDHLFTNAPSEHAAGNAALRCLASLLLSM